MLKIGQRCLSLLVWLLGVNALYELSNIASSVVRFVAMGHVNHFGAEGLLSTRSMGANRRVKGQIA